MAKNNECIGVDGYWSTLSEVANEAVGDVINLLEKHGDIVLNGKKYKHVYLKYDDAYVGESEEISDNDEMLREFETADILRIIELINEAL